MGGIGWDIKLEKLAPDADINVMMNHVDAFSDLFTEFIGYYANGPEADEFWSYWDHARWDERFVEIYDDAISFSFMDMAGCCSLSYNLAYYWTRLAFACQLEQFEAITINEGFQLAERLKPIDVIGENPESFFVRVRDQLWSFYPKYGFDLSGDSRSLEEKDLTTEEREKLERIVETKESEDPLSVMLTPHQSFQEALIGLFEDAHSVGSAMWYAGNVAKVSDELLRAALFSGALQQPEQIRWDARKVEKMATRCEASALDIVREALSQDNLAVKALATAAVAVFESEDADTTLLKETAIRNGLSAQSPYCDVAAAHLGSLSLDDAGKRAVNDQIVERLTAGSDNASTEHDLMLLIVNLWMQPRTAPENAMEVFRKFAVKENHEAADLAQWALNVFG